VRTVLAQNSNVTLPFAINTASIVVDITSPCLADSVESAGEDDLLSDAAKLNNIYIFVVNVVFILSIFL